MLQVLSLHSVILTQDNNSVSNVVSYTVRPKLPLFYQRYILEMEEVNHLYILLNLLQGDIVTMVH